MDISPGFQLEETADRMVRLNTIPSHSFGIGWSVTPAWRKDSSILATLRVVLHTIASGNTMKTGATGGVPSRGNRGVKPARLVASVKLTAGGSGGGSSPSLSLFSRICGTSQIPSNFWKSPCTTSTFWMANHDQIR